MYDINLQCHFYRTTSETRNLVATADSPASKITGSRRRCISAKSTRSGESCETSLRANAVPIFGRRHRRRRCLRRRRQRHDGDDYGRCKKKSKRENIAILFDLILADYLKWTKSTRMNSYIS